MNQKINNGYKMVNLKILVPDGDFCCKLSGVNTPHCGFFDNHGGHATCSMDVGSPELNALREGYLKPPACSDLLKD